jgi:enterochelin esterase-like enzyme
VGLTGLALVVVLAVVAGAALVATLWYWPRLAGRGVIPVLLRIAALGVVQLSVLALIFVIVNRSTGFYSSWSDLLGSQSGGGPVIAENHHARKAAGITETAAPVVVLASSPIAVPGRPGEPGGRLQAVRFYGRLSGVSVPGYIYLPPGYDAQPATAPLPVAVVISGQLDSPGRPYSARTLAATAARQIASRNLGPLIVVMLPATVGQHDQGCLNVPGGTQAALFFTEDVPRAVDSAYRAVPPADQRWALIGDPAGGYCALQLAMTNSGTFAAAAVPPGGYTAPPGPAEFGGSPLIRSQDNLSWLLGHRPMQPISVLFTGTGRGQSFLSQARPPMHVGRIGLSPGEWQLASVFDWAGTTLHQTLASRS